ncbi:aquaporin [Streptomyces sp. NPDC005708]|uniref:aquaporin n=1 Tax=unclassified Streptomyces TaxID=2593676 RepID=UPI00340EC322
MTQEGIFVGELIGSAVLILFGAGVRGAVTLDCSKAKGAGRVLIARFRTSADEHEALPRSSGHAINPARELGPCITHYRLPVPERGTPRRSCVWTPMVRPLIGGALTALVHNAAS